MGKIRTEPCAVFPVKSGVPIIGLGIFMILIPLITFIVSGRASLPLPVTVLFIGFGTFLIWLGVTK